MPSSASTYHLYFLFIFTFLSPTLFYCTDAAAQGNAMMSWDANTEDDLAGYNLYHGTSTGAYGSPTSLGLVTSHTVTGLQPGSHYFTVTAYDYAGNESAPTTEVSTTVSTTSNFQLSLVISGSGTVTSTTAGIACGTDCTEDYPVGTKVTLTATPGTGSSFSGWSGACSGTGSCVVTMAQAQSVTATFTVLPVTQALTVTLAGSGSGTVTSTTAGIACGTDCTEDYPVGTKVTLTATPGTGSSFSGWSGACQGNAACNVTLTSIQSVTAQFSEDPSEPPTPDPSPSPSVVSYMINFQPSGSTIPDGFQKDHGATYSPHRGYGWSRSLSDRDRQRNPDQRLDTFVYTSNRSPAIWTYDLPNGTYLVSFASGDASWGQGPHQITVEGESVINNLKSGRDEYVTLTDYPVTVTDGALTIALGGASRGNTMLNYVTITPGSSNPEPIPDPSPTSYMINFQPSGSTIPDGFQKDHGTTYSPHRGYGWSRSLEDRDRQRNPDQRLDTFVYTSNRSPATWTYDLPNGTYLVSLASGDASWSQGPHQITVEGESVINNLRSGRDEYVTLTDYPVTVTDGALTIALGGASRGNTMLNYVMIRPANPVLHTAVQ